MLYIALAIVVVLVVGVIALTLSRPSAFRVERSIDIKNSAESAYAVLSDFHQFGSWSPWEHKNPNMKRKFSGAATGKGAIHEWEGNKDIGQGRQEIIDAVPNSKIAIKLDFMKPFPSTNAVEYLIEPGNGTTKVRWIMQGSMNFIMRLMGLNMDKLIGKDFETGLANLKAVLEK